jgi:hypothetical protein
VFYLTKYAREPEDGQYWLKHVAQLTEKACEIKVCVKSDKECQRIIYKTTHRDAVLQTALDIFLNRNT